jgi:PhnB protein
MTTKVKPIPDGHHSVTPYLTVKYAASALEFYKKAFGATELLRHIDPTNGRVGHAELRIGDSLIMLSGEYPDMNAARKRWVVPAPQSISMSRMSTRWPSKRSPPARR